MLPFVADNLEKLCLLPGDRVYLPGIRALLEGDGETITAAVLRNGGGASPGPSPPARASRWWAACSTPST